MMNKVFQTAVDMRQLSHSDPVLVRQNFVFLIVQQLPLESLSHASVFLLTDFNIISVQFL